MRIEDDVKLDFDDVLIRPKRSTLKSRKDVNLNRTFTFKHSGQRWTGVPIIASNMSTIGTWRVADVFQRYGMLTAMHKHYCIETWNEWLYRVNADSIIPTIGASDEDLENLIKILSLTTIPPIRTIMVDVANGYGEYFVDFVEKVRKRFPNHTIMAGNVVTREMTEQLILSGADVVKVGIGSGSVCTTRLVAGVGYPQLSAIAECADAAHGIGGRVIADGGCRTPGDIAKAFGAGADFVMLGGMLAGHDETGEDYYGMSSKKAQERFYDGQKDYRASEGKEVTVENRGPLEETVQNILGGLRSTCAYVGARELKELSKCTTFIRVSRTHNTVFG